MQSADLQACLGFLQAIHYSAKVANVNKEVCQSLSRVVGRIRPCLEEVDMADTGEQHNSSLCMIESSLESIQIAIGRFSTMGYLQSVLEAQAMCDNFSKSRDNMIKALENLAESRKPCSTKDWRDDVQRICELLKGLRFEDCDHLQVAKRVHATSRQIIEGEMSVKSGQVIIRSQLLANRSIGPKAMQEEIQGLERELSRARVEKQQHEVEELHTIIRALKQSSSDSDQDSRPQPPVEYLCPISQRIMKDPVVLVETGQTYDRKYIEEWFGRGNRTCPATKQTVTELNLTPNYALKSLASSWLDVNWDGDDDDDENDVIFHRSSETSEVADAKTPADDVKKIVASCTNGGGYPTMIECGYSTMDIPSISQVLTSTSSSADSTSLKSKKGIESVGASRESYSGKNYSTQKEELSPKKHLAIHAMQTANVVNPLATATNTSLNLGGRQGAATAVPSLASKLAFAKRLNSRFADIAETRSTDQYEATTPRSTFSELPKRMSSVDSMGLNDAIQALKAARRLQFELDNEEHTPRSTRSANKLLFRTDNKAAQLRQLAPMLPRRNYAAPSVYSATSRASRGEREAELREYEELDKLENGSEVGSEQQPTDEAEEDFWDNAEFDAASLTTIGSHAPHYAASIASMIPAKKGVQMCTGFMQGATNVLFGENEGIEEDGSSSVAEEEDSNDISMPVLADMLKTNDLELAASLASNLAFKAQTDPQCIQDIPRLNMIPSLVKLLVLPSDAVKSAAARALGVIGERSPEAKFQILNCGAISVLSRLNKHAEESQDSEKEEGSLEDVAGATRFALSALNSSARNAPSVDVSPQMLVELLMSTEDDLQASAVLELLEKLNSVYADVVLKELTESDVLMTLVDMLEHSEEDVQFAAADILGRMIFHDQKTQIELSQSLGIVSKLLRLIKQGGSESSTSCKSAAAQVIRGLAHNNSKIREDVLRRGVIPEFASLLCSNDVQTRETAAWMLGIMASHSQVGQDEVVCCDQAMFMLEELSVNGIAQEKVAAKFALRAVNSEGVGCDDDELSSPIVIHSLEVGTKEVRIAAAWELCRMASSNQWSQIEIYECGGVTALLGYLKARPGADGIQACLATLVKLASNEARIAAQISQEGGVLLAVRLLKSPATPDKKLVIQLLTLLAEKCPLHQQEVVSNGAVPVLVDLLFSEEVICMAAYQALRTLLENDLSVIPTSVAECATPTLLDIVANSESPSFSKKAAVQLLGKMGEAAFESQQVVVKHGGIDLLMDTMQNGDDHEVMLAAAQAMKSLSSKRFRDQGRGTIPKLLQALETSAPSRKSKMSGLVKMGEYVAPTHLATCNSFGSSTSSHSAEVSTRPGRRPSIVPPLVLPNIPESFAEESEVEEADDTQSATLQESPESPLSRTTYEPTPKKMPPTPFEMCTNDAFSDYPESIAEETKIKPAPPSVASSVRRAPSIRGYEEPRKSKAAQRKGITDLQNIVENIRSDDGHATHKTAAAIGELRNLVSTNRHMGSHLLKTGAVGLLIDRLRTQSYR